MKKIFMFLILAIFCEVSLLGWGSHYLITMAALEHPSLKDLHLDREILPEELEVFIQKEKEGLYQLLKEYYEDLYKYKPSRMNPAYKENPFDKNNPTVQNFIKALRLNPDARFLLVNRVLKGQKARYQIVPVQKIYPFYKDQGFHYEFEDVKGKQVSIRSILITFADEPDWVMDHHLWEIESYGYGKQPYGEPKGESSKAPFHMQFKHEPFIVKVAAKFLLEGMAVERITLFMRLAHFAKETGHDYWAYRFLAWALHYYQDLAQPYHARSVPEANTWFYVRFIFSLDKKGFQQRTSQVLKNKHFIYEDFVSVYLEKMIVENNDISNSLANYLKSDKISVLPDGFEVLLGTSNLNHLHYDQVVTKLTDYSAGHAYELDQSIQKVFPEKFTKDYNYDIETDPNYKLSDIMPLVSADNKRKLIEQTGKDFMMTGQITRFVIYDLKKNKLNL